MKKNIVIAVLATVVVLFVALLLYGLSLGSTSQVQSTSSTVVDREIKLESLDGFKEVYMASCDDNGTMESYCSCTYDYFIANYSVDKLVEIGEKYDNTGVISDEMMDAAVACADRL